MPLPTPGQFIFMVLFWSAAAMYVFWHAERHGTGNPTRWGIATFLLGALVVPVYFIRYWRRGRR